MKDNKAWVKRFLVTFAIVVTTIAAVTAFIDPYYHYHKPLSFISYRLIDERYINDGIARNFEYDAIIIGTSMTQNCKPSQWEELTGQRTVKLPFSGGDFLEMHNQLERAFEYNPEIETVIWCIDYDSLIREYDFRSYEYQIDYMYDNNPFNDVKYLLNKDVIFHGVLADLERTFSAEPTTSLDDYSSWDIDGGLDHILYNYKRLETAKAMEPDLSAEIEAMVLENVTKNITELTDKHPDVTFLLFYPPYSIVHWDMCNREGWTLRHFEAEQIATEEFLKHDNIKLYNFFDNFELTCNLENYKDPEHYVSDVNSWILEQLVKADWMVTKDNYLERMNKAHEFYLNYDFDSIFN